MSENITSCQIRASSINMAPLYFKCSSPPAKVTELEHGCLRVQQQVLGLDVPMADPKGMDVGQAPEELVHVHLQRKMWTHTT